MKCIYRYDIKISGEWQYLDVLYPNKPLCVRGYKNRLSLYVEVNPESKFFEVMKYRTIGTGDEYMVSDSCEWVDTFEQNGVPFHFYIKKRAN